MTDYHPNESAYLNYLKSHKDGLGLDVVGQIDAWARTSTGGYVFDELKSQEPFRPPPFHGHGLPRWQIDKYQRMTADLGVTWRLVVLDPESGAGYRQSISALEGGEFVDTHGASPRRIYPLDAFEIWTPDWRKTLGLP